MKKVFTFSLLFMFGLLCQTAFAAPFAVAPAGETAETPTPATDDAAAKSWEDMSRKEKKTARKQVKQELSKVHDKS